MSNMVKIRCEKCVARGVTFVWATVKCSSGYGSDMVKRNVQIAVKCELCSGNGFIEGQQRLSTQLPITTMGRQRYKGGREVALFMAMGQPS